MSFFCLKDGSYRNISRKPHIVFTEKMDPHLDKLLGGQRFEARLHDFCKLPVLRELNRTIVTPP
jgi:hypothetical protein